MKLTGIEIPQQSARALRSTINDSPCEDPSGSFL
jgi:hypothetical protein